MEKKLYIHPATTICAMGSACYVMTHVSGGLIHSTEEKADPSGAMAPLRAF